MIFARPSANFNFAAHFPDNVVELWLWRLTGAMTFRRMGIDVFGITRLIFCSGEIDQFTPVKNQKDSDLYHFSNKSNTFTWFDDLDFIK